MKQEAIDKLNQELEAIQGDKTFHAALAAHLISLDDNALDERMLMDKKTITSCTGYIIEFAKSKKSGICAVMTDEEVYGKAVEYYMSDKTVVKTAASNTVQVAAPAAKIPATEATPVMPKAKPKAPVKPITGKDDQMDLFGMLEVAEEAGDGEEEA